jgi:hypothetical protein
LRRPIAVTQYWGQEIPETMRALWVVVRWPTGALEQLVMVAPAAAGDTASHVDQELECRENPSFIDPNAAPKATI